MVEGVQQGPVLVGAFLIIICFHGSGRRLPWSPMQPGRAPTSGLGVPLLSLNAKNNLNSVLYKNRQNLGISVQVSACFIRPLLLSGAACRSSKGNWDLSICDAIR